MRNIGNVRKQLGLSFLGETREADWLLYGDVKIEGLDEDVSVPCCAHNIEWRH